MEIEAFLLETLAQRVGPERFDRWFTDTRLVYADERLQVIAPSRFLASWQQKNYSRDLAETCLRVFGRDCPIEFVAETKSSSKSAVKDSSRPYQRQFWEEEPVAEVELRKDSIRLTEKTAPEVPPIVSDVSVPASAEPDSVLPAENGQTAEKEPVKTVSAEIPENRPIPKVPASRRGRPAAVSHWGTLNDFVVGHSNRMARSVADLVIAGPGKFNPVFLSGPTSVGKTHLLEGVYSAFRAAGGRKTPLFMTADQFTTLFTESVRPGGDRKPFLDRFKSVSLFVLDDVHFLAGKEKTQFELIALLDRLRREGVQMIFSADRPLGELTNLRSELISRLQAGVVCDIKPAERETLLTIFMRTALRLGLPISEETARLIVSRYATHARQLSGVANLLCAKYLTSGKPLTIESVSEILGDFSQMKRQVRLEDIEKAVAEVFELKPASLRGKSRARECSYPRMLAMWLARKYTRSALSEIGRYFGNRSHSTVISAQKRVDAWLDEAEGPNSGPMPERRTAEAIHRLERILVG